ncbi:MAG: hypothetical protein U1C58_13115 [Flavobacteriaceae bacterium]|nr:hypothetical protein [Flavobacteriaceae bacterium]MDZ4149224.1 hypothetical protein [Flavobacteriaceae bacterium]
MTILICNVSPEASESYRDLFEVINGQVGMPKSPACRQAGKKQEAILRRTNLKPET